MRKEIIERNLGDERRGDGGKESGRRRRGKEGGRGKIKEEIRVEGRKEGMVRRKETYGRKKERRERARDKRRTQERESRYKKGIETKTIRRTHTKL